MQITYISDKYILQRLSYSEQPSIIKYYIFICHHWTLMNIYSMNTFNQRVQYNSMEYHSMDRVLFENRPALYFCNYIFITAYIIYIFFNSVSKILYKTFMYWSQRLYLIMILIMEILLHNVYKSYLRLPNLFFLLC